jgi:hypothetical protein
MSWAQEAEKLFQESNAAAERADAAWEAEQRSLHEHQERSRREHTARMANAKRRLHELRTAKTQQQLLEETQLLLGKLSGMKQGRKELGRFKTFLEARLKPFQEVASEEEPLARAPTFSIKYRVPRLPGPEAANPKFSVVISSTDKKEASTGLKITWRKAAGNPAADGNTTSLYEAPEEGLSFTEKAEKILSEAFKLYDPKGTGLMGKTEIKSLMSSMEQFPGDDKLLDLVRAMGGDPNELTISLQNLKSWVPLVTRLLGAERNCHGKIEPSPRRC